MPQHPLLFAMHQTNNAYTTAIPSTMLCRSYKVRNYQLIFLWIKNHSPSLVFASTSHRPHGNIQCAPNSLFHHVQSPGRLKCIDGEGRKRYEGETLFHLHVLLMIWSYLDCFESADASWLDPSHLPHEPHPPSEHITREEMQCWKGAAAMWGWVIMACNSSFANFWLFYSSALCFVKHDNKTLHNNQTPRDNQPSNQLY